LNPVWYFTGQGEMLIDNSVVEKLEKEKRKLTEEIGALKERNRQLKQDKQ
jgi:hypothetical protein